jgi:hypothetical protein
MVKRRFLSSRCKENLKGSKTEEMIPDNTIQLNGLYLDVMLLQKKGYCCSQIMAIIMLKYQGRDDPELVRAIGGLCHGIGGIHDTCGVLSGGVCLISLHSGKGSDEETPDRQLPLMFLELAEWFKARTGGTLAGMRCEEIMAGCLDQRVCLSLITETYEKVLSILQSHDVGKASDRSG